MRTKVQNLTIGNNAGETTTATLVFMALHDMYGFSKKRMERLKNQCNKYNYESLANDPKFTGKALASANAWNGTSLTGPYRAWDSSAAISAKPRQRPSKRVTSTYSSALMSFSSSASSAC